jgi:hypothetical protein
MAAAKGETNAATPGNEGIVTKLHVADQGPVPAAFLARTRQKYVVPFAKGPTAFTVVVKLESSTRSGVKLDALDNCTQYVDAEVTAFQVRDGEIA